MALATKSLIVKARWLAIILFAGTLGVFILFFLTQFSIDTLESLILFGFCYVLVALILTIGAFLILLWRAYIDTPNRGKILFTSLLLTLNIPVMLAYCWFIVLLVRSMA
jgi:hypothetical protein